MSLPTSFDELTLAAGCHDDRTEGMCAMEAAAWFAGEKHSDHPKCVHPQIAYFMRVFNDHCITTEQRDRFVKPLIPLCLDTACDLPADVLKAIYDTAGDAAAVNGEGFYESRTAGIRAMCAAAREHLDREPTITIPDDFTVLAGV